MQNYFKGAESNNLPVPHLQQQTYLLASSIATGRIGVEEATNEIARIARMTGTEAPNVTHMTLGGLDILSKGQGSHFLNQLIAQKGLDKGTALLPWREVIRHTVDSFRTGFIESESPSSYQFSPTTGVLKPSDFVAQKAITPIFLSGVGASTQSRIAQRTYLSGTYTQSLFTQMVAKKVTTLRSKTTSPTRTTGTEFKLTDSNTPIIFNVLEFWRGSDQFGPARLTVNLDNYSGPVSLMSTSDNVSTLAWFPLDKMFDSSEAWATVGDTTSLTVTTTVNSDGALAMIKDGVICNVTEVGDNTQFRLTSYFLGDRDAAQAIMELVTSGCTNSAYDQALRTVHNTYVPGGGSINLYKNLG